MFLLLLTLVLQPSFEVASVKPTAQRARAVGTVRIFPGGRVTIEASPLEHLMELAFDVQRFQVAGGPDWAYTEGFDIEARSEAHSSGSRLSDDQRRMLLALLVERFQLKTHRETRQGQIYSLVQGKKLKFLETQKKDTPPWVNGPETGIAGGNVSMPFLARRLSRWLDRPVVDRTGLTGAYDFKYTYDTGDPDLTASILGSVEGLGLMLVAGKGTVETVVIDHAEKPSAN